MANNALDDILNMEERTDQTSMPEDTTSLDDIINFEDRKGGETSTDVPTNPHGVMHTAAEAADVLYHLLVLLKAAGVSPDDVMAELRRREGVGGLAEKAARPHD